VWSLASRLRRPLAKVTSRVRAARDHTLKTGHTRRNFRLQVRKYVDFAFFGSTYMWKKTSEGTFLRSKP
jgi:hypothetical protein